MSIHQICIALRPNLFVVLVLSLTLLACSKSRENEKNAQHMTVVEREAVQQLLMAAYDEAFRIEPVYRMFLGTQIYRDPRSDTPLDPPIYTASVTSGMVTFDPSDAKRRLKPILAKKRVSWPADDGGRFDLRIMDYEVDYTPGTGNTITVIPLSIQINKVMPQDR